MTAFRIALLAVMIGCLATYSAQARQDDAKREDARTVQVVESSEELREALQPKPELRFGAVRDSSLTIHVDDSVRYQRIDGFGASLTDSSAWLLWHKLTEGQRKEALEMLFSRAKGIGLSILRQPMGASDFALHAYSYDDLPPGETDPQLKKFTIEHDRAYILPLLREALAMNPDLKIIATPWSPPGWMKTSDSMIQGVLLPAGYAPLAHYFVKYVQAYETAGVPIYAITPQNEPLNIPGDYPGMGMTAAEQTVFLREYLGPALREAKLETKILIFDHNWDLIEFPVKVLNDRGASQFVSGIATHCYGGSVTAQSELHRRFPDKDIWMTECSGGEWQKGKLLQQQARLIIGTTRHWARSVVLWNLALNQDHRPYLGGCTTCRGVITVSDATTLAHIVPTVDYTALGHASKFVVPGAQRVESNTFEQGSLEDVAFRDPDGSLVLLVLNGGPGPVSFNIEWRGKFAAYKLESAALATFRWSGTSTH